MSSSDDEEDTLASSSSTPWKVSLKPTGKGGDIRQGVSLAAPITFFPKDDSRLYHDGVNNLQLRETETQARKGKAGDGFDLPKLRNRSKSPVPNVGNSRSKSPGPVLPKNTSLSRSQSPVPDSETSAAAGTDNHRSRSKTPRVQVKAAVPVSEEKRASSDLEHHLLTLQQQLNQSQEKCQNLSKENEDLTEQLLQEPVAISPLTSPPAACVSCERFNGEITFLRQEKMDLESHHQTLKDRVVSLQNEKDDLQAQLASGSTSSRQALQEMKSQINAQTVEVDSFKTESASAATEQQITDTNTNKAELQAELDTAKNNSQTLQEELAAARAETDAVKSQLNQCTSQVEALQHELETVSKDKQEICDSVSLLRSEVSLVKEGLEKSHKKNQQIQNERDSALAKLEKVKVQIESKLQATEESNVKLQETNARVTKLLETCKLALREDLMGTIQAKEEEISDLQNHNLIIESDKKELQQQLEEQIEECQSNNNIILQETNAKGVELLETCKLALREDLMGTIQAKEEEISNLQSQNQMIESENRELQCQLEEQIEECQSIRKEIQQTELKKGQAKAPIIAKLQEEVKVSKQQFQEIRQSLEDAQKGHDEAVSNFQAAEVKGREDLESYMLENTLALQEAQEKIAALEAAVSKMEVAKNAIVLEYAEKVGIQEATIQKLKEERGTIETEFASLVIENANVQAAVVENERLIGEIKQQLDEALEDLTTVTMEKATVLDKLTATVEKAQAAITATEEMKMFLEDDEKTILQLRSKMTRMEIDREELSSKLKNDIFERDEAISSRGPSFEINPEELERGMNMPVTMEDSFAGFDIDFDANKGSKNRRSSIAVLEELEQDLKNLLFASDEILPACNGKDKSPGANRARSPPGGRQMSILVRQKQRDSIEEEVLSDIRDA